MFTVHPAAARVTHRLATRSRGVLPAILIVTLGLTTLPASLTQAAGVNPLPEVASALNGVRSYEVTITTTTSGARPPRSTRTPQPGATPGARSGRGGNGRVFVGGGTETLIAVRKAAGFEVLFTFEGRNAAGKPVTTSIVSYDGKMCRQATNGKGYTCQTPTYNGNGRAGGAGFFTDPTAAFAQGAGSTTFAEAGSKTIAGQVCDGYSYSNKGVTISASGTVYIARATHLPCRQIATVTTRFGNGAGSFTRTQTITWSRFNDPHLTVPALS